MSARAWYREPMLLLVIGLPAAAVVAGLATLAIAAAGAGDAGDARVRRIAQTQTADLAPDHAAARLGLAAGAAIDGHGAVSLSFEGPAPAALALELRLRHATDSGRDRSLRLVRAGEGGYAGRLEMPRAAGAYNLELAPEDGGWRLVGRLEAGSARVGLRPALDIP